MIDERSIIGEAEAFVIDYFRKHLPRGLVYHTVAHSKQVAKTAAKLADESGLAEDAIEIVILAGLLHDLGYTERYKGHEEISITLAIDFLTKYHYPQAKIELIVGCIEATKIPQHPKNILEEIVADADLAGLGRKSFAEQSELLRIEWEQALGKTYTNAEWLEQNIALLGNHTFFTEAAKKRYGKRQTENLISLRQFKMPTPPVQPPILAAEYQPMNENESKNGFYILLHAMAQRQLGSQFLLNVEAMILIACSVALLFLSIAHISHGTGFEPLVISPFIVGAAAGLAALVSAANALAIRGRYFEDRLAKGSLEEFEEHLAEIQAENLLEDTIVTDCYEHRSVVLKKRKLIRFAATIFVLGLLIASLMHLILKFS